MGALELKSTEPAGRMVAPQLRSPASEMVRGVRAIVAVPNSLKSLGVAQGIPPSQNSATPVLGVAPEMIVATSANAALAQVT